MDGAMKQQPKKQTLKTFNTKEKPMEVDKSTNEEPRQSTPQNKTVLSTEYIYSDENGNLCDGVRIHPEFQKLIHPLVKEELNELEAGIKKNGCLDPIKVWKGYIVDGHHRHRICEKHSIPYEVLDMDFDDECDVNIWMINNQLGRRNLTDAARIEYASKKVDLIRGAAHQRQEDSRFQKENDLNKLDPKTRRFFERKKEKRKVLVNAAVGSIAGVGARTVAKYNYVKKHSDEDTLKNLKEGTLVPFGNKGKKKKLSVDGLYRELRAKEKKTDQSGVIKEIFTVSANRHSSCNKAQPKETQEAVPREDLSIDGISTRIITHPIAELSKYVNPSSIDVIITEPPCKEEDIDLFDQL
ncbi:MAG: ParB N-terminal domain-containing protein, partial [archaeon]|nr:ParB N-terminal domain-containing protein [archaeon]